MNKRKNTHFQQNLVVFSAATDAKIIIIQKLHGKRTNKNWTELSSLGQEPTFKQFCSLRILENLPLYGHLEINYISSI